MTEPKVTALAEKAMLVKLTTKRVNLTKRDEVAEAIIQTQMDDASLIVNSKLFRDKANPINKIMTAISEVYTYHRKNTLPYMDKGPRILPNAMYMDYTAEMRGKIGQVDALINKYMPDYDHYVQLDISYRSKGPRRATVDDYPTALEFKQRVGFDLRFMPLPDKKHFLFDLSDADVANFTQAMQDTERMARNDAIERMLKPLTHLVEKLNKPIGTDGSVFRDSAIENVAEGVEIARKLLIDATPEVSALVDGLNAEVSKFVEKKEWLRESPVVRLEAAKKLDDIARQMGAFMGV